MRTCNEVWKGVTVKSNYKYSSKKGGTGTGIPLQVVAFLLFVQSYEEIRKSASLKNNSSGRN